MKIKRDELLNALSTVQPGLAGGKEIIEQSQSFVFLDKHIVTFNDEIAVSIPFQTGFTCAVKASELYQLMSKMKDAELELSLGEGELRLETSHLRSGIKIEAEVKLPFSEVKLPEKWVGLPADFSAALAFCMFSAGVDKSRPVLNCLCIRKGSVLSCDNFRLTQYRMPEGSAKFFPPKDVLVPSGAASYLIKLQPKYWGMTGGWLHFKLDSGAVFSARTLDEAFPAVEGLMEVDEAITIELPDNLTEAVERAASLVEACAGRVDVSIDGNKLLITGKGEFGWVKEKAVLKSGSAKCSFSIRPHFLKELLMLTHTVIIGNNRMKIQGDKFTHVTALLARV